MSKEYIVPLSEDEAFYGYKGMTVELIRCKDCKYWGADGYRYGCKYAVQIMTEDNYCSRAERKEE